MPTKPRDVQAAMKTHLSQPTGVGAFDGQHGMSPAISSVISEADILSAIACIDMSANEAAMTGWDRGANARPAITRIASSRRMVKFRFTELESRNLVAIARRPAFHIINSVRPELIGINDKPELSPDYLSVRPADRGHRFRHLFPLIGLVAAGREFGGSGISTNWPGRLRAPAIIPGYLLR